MITLPHGAYDVVGSIVLYQTPPDELQRAIRQFLAIPLRTHLCIIDNSPSPRRIAEFEHEAVSYHFAGRNLGYGRAHNIALQAAAGRSRYSLVMNTDIEYQSDVVVRLKRFLDDRPSAGLASPRILNPDGTLQHVCRLLPTPANLFLRRFLPNARSTQAADWEYELRWWDHRDIANIPYFQGSFLLMRTDLCTTLGGFDDRFFLYGEDIDLTRRMHKVAETCYVPDVAITHEYRRYSSKSLRGTWYGIQNNCRYFNKWGWFFDTERNAINATTVARIRASRPQ